MTLLMTVTVALASLAAGAVTPQQRLNAEAAAFTGNMPAGLQAAQESAVRQAMAGDCRVLEAVRSSRNAAPGLPDDVAATDACGGAYRIYRPANASGPLPLLVYLHGGGWCFGSINSCSAFCVELARRAGIAVMAVDYPLAPESPWPAAPDACAAAVEFAAAHAGEYGFDADCISLGGDSAGGNLALSVALGRPDLGLSSLVLFYPVVKVWNDGSESWRDYGAGFGLDGGLMEAFNEAYLAGRDPSDPLISPFCAPDSLLSGLPPVLTVSADCDILRDQATAMCARMSAAGADVRHRILPGTTHLFITVAGQPSAFGEAVDLTAAFVRERALESRLRRYVAGWPGARIGAAVVPDGGGTVSVAGADAFPMLSVYKFPQALAVAAHCRRNGLSLSDSIDIAADEIKTGTWSPLRDRYGVGDLRLPLRELLALTLQQSDNNACDVLFRFIGGPAVADSLMKAMGYDDIVIRSTEDEMHRDTGLCYVNSSTPLAMARLMDDFSRTLRHEWPECAEIAALMENCSTGADRLAAPLTGKNAVVGHKTGTGDKNSDGRIIAVNDAGYVVTPDGRRYSIAVFVSDSEYDMATTSAIIAGISAIVGDGMGLSPR